MAPTSDFADQIRPAELSKASAQAQAQVSPEYDYAASLAQSTEQLQKLEQEVFGGPVDAYMKSKQASLDAVALVLAALAIVRHVPPSPDRSAALRKIREARMDCNSAITHRGKY
jgi:hypothetical protein